MSIPLDTRRWVAVHIRGTTLAGPVPSCPLHPDERSRHHIRADELGERSTRIPLCAGFVTAAALALAALVAFPPYRTDVLWVLPWILFAL